MTYVFRGGSDKLPSRRRPLGLARAAARGRARRVRGGVEALGRGRRRRRGGMTQEQGLGNGQVAQIGLMLLDAPSDLLQCLV